jgi:hypothetical protein
MFMAVLVAGMLEGTPVALVEQVSRAMAQERDVQVRLGTAWIKHARTWDIKDAASPKLSKDEEFRVWRTTDGSRQILIRQNGAPAAGTPKPPDTELGTLEPDRYAYRWNITPEQQMDGRPCWVLDFSPLNPLPKADGIKEDIALQLTGTIWIDRERLFVRRVEAHLNAPFRRRLAGILSVSDARATLTNQDIDGRIIPGHTEMSVWSSFLGVTSVQRTEFDYSGIISGFVPPSR